MAAVSGPLRLPRPWGPHLRRRLTVLGLIAVVGALGYWFWFRDSAFVAVEQVTIAGGETAAADSYDALRRVGTQQSTLAVDEAALREAVVGDPSIRDLSVSADFPHGLAIELDVRRPVAWLGSGNLLVGDDGVVLAAGGDAPDGVPSVDLRSDEVPSVAAGEAVDGAALEIATTLGAAPEPLLGEVRTAELTSEHGVVVTLTEDIELRFGDRRETGLKWRAAATVLADPKLESASYLDLSVADRPVAGGVG